MILSVARMVRATLSLIFLFGASSAFCAAPDSSKNNNPFADTPDSRWLTSQSERYSALLKQSNWDVLVPPFSVDGHSLDIVGRTMLARMVAARIEANSDYRVADPGILERALGERFRAIDPIRALELAGNVGAKFVVIGKVGHNRLGEMSVTSVVYRQQPDGQYIEHETIRNVEPLLFSDEQLPYEAFRPLALTIATAVQASSSGAKLQHEGADLLKQTIPVSFAALLERANQSSFDEAVALIFLGELTPLDSETRARDHLFERALVSLEEVSPDVIGYRYLQARALFQLRRRPSAIAVLGEPASFADKALLALMNGNLAQLREYAAEVTEPIPRLFAEFDIQEIGSRYSRRFDSEYALKLAEAHPEWTMMIYRRMLSADRWPGKSNSWVKITLDQVIPIAGFSAGDLTKSKLAEQDFPSEFDFAELSMDHIDRFIEQSLGDKLAKRLSSRALYIGDFIESVIATLVLNNLSNALTENDARGNTDRAMEILAEYDTLYAEEPLLTLGRSMLLMVAALKEKEGRARQNLTKDFTTAANRGFYWYGGQHILSLKLASRMAYPGSVFDNMPNSESERLRYLSDFPSLPERYAASLVDVRDSVSYGNCLRYVVYDLACLKSYHSFLSGGRSDREGNTIQKRDPQAAQDLLDRNADRFVGHPERVQFLAEVRKKAGDFEGEAAVYREAIATGSIDWKPYAQVGMKLARDGQYAQAMDVFLSFPGFRDEAGLDNVTLSNHAYLAGNLPFWAGQYEFARPPYELSAAYQTGSDASMASRIRLDLLSGELHAAAQGSLKRAKRYDSKYAWRDYMAMLHLFGEGSSSWDLFYGLIARVSDPELWSAAFVGHRIEGKSSQEIAKLLQEDARVTAMVARSHESFRHIPRYLLMTGVIDRFPHVDLADLIADSDPGRVSMRQADGLVMEGERKHWVPTVFLDLGDRAKLAPGPVKSRLSMAARGLTLMRKENYQGAYDAMTELAQAYELGEFLGYYAWVSFKAGHTSRIDLYLADQENFYVSMRRAQGAQKQGWKFDDDLARAMLAGGRGQHVEALRYLENARNDRPFTGERSIFPYYRIVEAAEILYGESRHDDYREYALDLARRFQHIQPMYPWPYAVVGRYSENKAEQDPYLGTAIHLDPNSYNVSLVTAARKAAALEWLKKNGPMYLITSLTVAPDRL